MPVRSTGTYQYIIPERSCQVQWVIYCNNSIYYKPGANSQIKRSSGSLQRGRYSSLAAGKLSNRRTQTAERRFRPSGNTLYSTGGEEHRHSTGTPPFHGNTGNRSRHMPGIGIADRVRPLFHGRGIAQGIAESTGGNTGIPRGRNTDQGAGEPTTG